MPSSHQMKHLLAHSRTFENSAHPLSCQCWLLLKICQETNISSGDQPGPAPSCSGPAGLYGDISLQSYHDLSHLPAFQLLYTPEPPRKLYFQDHRTNTVSCCLFQGWDSVGKGFCSSPPTVVSDGDDHVIPEETAVPQFCGH